MGITAICPGQGGISAICPGRHRGNGGFIFRVWRWNISSRVFLSLIMLGVFGAPAASGKPIVSAVYARAGNLLRAGKGNCERGFCVHLAPGASGERQL